MSMNGSNRTTSVSDFHGTDLRLDGGGKRLAHYQDQIGIMGASAYAETMRTISEKGSSQIIDRDTIITAVKFRGAVKRLKKIAPGPDGIRYDDISRLSDKELDELASIFTSSLESGMVPEDWLYGNLTYGSIAIEKIDVRSPANYNVSWTGLENGVLSHGHWSIRRKATVTWFSLNNRIVDTPTPTVRLSGVPLIRTNIMKYLGVHFDRSLRFTDHVDHTITTARKGLAAMRVMATAQCGAVPRTCPFCDGICSGNT